MHVGLRWTNRSSPAVAATAIAACWTFAIVFAALVANLLGFDGFASRVMGWAGLVGLLTLVLGTLAVIASLVVERDRPLAPERIRRRPEAVSRPLR